MIFQLKTLSILTLTLLASGLAEANQPVKIRYQEVSVLAEVAIVEEVTEFNTLLIEKNPRADRHLLKARSVFRKNGIYEIAPEYLIDKCIYQAHDIENFLSPTLTLDDDETYSKKNRLTEVSDLYGRKFYKSIYLLCDRAKARFSKRLKSLKFKNSDFNLSAHDRSIIVELSFLPTIEGKQTFLDQLNQRGIGIAVVIVGTAAGAALGLALPGIILSVVYVADESSQLIQSVKNLNPTVYQLESPYSLNGSTLEIE